MKRIQTGIDTLDSMLNGGIPAGSVVLIAGHPGSGKTIMAHQMMFRNASPDFKIIYLTTLAEPQVKVLRFQQEFSFFDRSKVQNSIIYHDLGHSLAKNGPAKVIATIDGLLKTYEPGLVVIDSIKAMADMIPGMNEFREFMLDLTVRINAWGSTALLLAEYGEEDIEIRPECAFVDGIIYLSGMEEKKQQKRFMRITKMRGTSYFGGENVFKITDDGIKLYPRLNPDVTVQNYLDSAVRISWGVPEIDDLTGGGIPGGSATLITGGAGTGKTLMALHFINAGLEAGETAVYVTFEQDPAQMLATAGRFGMNFEAREASGQLRIVHVSPMELDVDEHTSRISDAVHSIGAKRIVIDSISAFELGMPDKSKYTDHIWALSDYFRSRGVSLLMTHETHDYHLTEFTKHGISYVADNLVLLQFIENGQDLKRGLRVVKMRSSVHSLEMCEFYVGVGGIHLARK